MKEEGVFEMFSKRVVSLLSFFAVAMLAKSGAVEAQDFKTMEQFQAMPLTYPKFMIDNLWILISAALVFIMHLGFATLETGLTQQKKHRQHSF